MDKIKTWEELTRELAEIISEKELIERELSAVTRDWKEAMDERDELQNRLNRIRQEVVG